MNLETCNTLLIEAHDLFFENKYEESKELLFTIERYVNSIENELEFASPEILRNGIYFRAQCLIIRGHISYRYGDLSPALDYYTQAYNIASDQSTPWIRGKALGSMGMIYFTMSEFERALEYLNKALPYFTEDKYKNEYAKILSNIGNSYTYMSNFSQAISYLKQALIIHESLNLPADIARDLINIGNIYFNMEDYDSALHYLNKSLPMLPDIQDQTIHSVAFTNIANVYMNRKQATEALQHYERALEISESIGHKHDISTILGNMGLSYTLLQEYTLALQCHKKAQTLSEYIGDTFGIAFNIACTGLLLSNPDYDLYNPTQAEQHLLKALALFEETGNKKEKYECHKDLAALFRHTQEWEKFAFHLEKYYQIKQDIHNQEVKKESEIFIRERENMFKERERTLLLEKNNVLEQANMFKTKLLGIAAHDLKNPLSNILGAAGVIREDIDKPDSIREWLEIIEGSAQRMNYLINDLLESSAAALGSINIQKSTCRINEILYAVCTQCEPLLRRKEQLITISILEEYYVEGDEKRLFQVFENIVSNASKYSFPQTVISVRAERIDTSVQVSIIDKGQGLSAEDLEKIFGQFQKLSSVPTGGEHSTGLGLHIVKHILELHNGRIWAESTGKGLGTTFVVELPLIHTEISN